MRETVVILCMAGMNVVVALQTLVPQFLLRFGMELRWIDRMGVLIAAFALVNLVVTLWFQASVDAQRGAYAATVLALISNASIVSTLDRWRRRSGSAWPLRVPWGFGLISGFFVLSTAAVVYRSPSALFIAFAFIITILLTSVLSRALRVREYRTTGFEFVDTASEALWDRHLVFGEGNVPWKAREIMIRKEPDPERRPRAIIG